MKYQHYSFNKCKDYNELKRIVNDIDFNYQFVYTDLINDFRNGLYTLKDKEVYKEYQLFLESKRNESFIFKIADGMTINKVGELKRYTGSIKAIPFDNLVILSNTFAEIRGDAYACFGFTLNKYKEKEK